MCAGRTVAKAANARGVSSGDSESKGHDADAPVPKFDLADFHVGPSDTKGANERIWIRCPPQLFRQIRVIVGSKKFPFRTVGDFARVAFFRLSKELMQYEEGLPNYIAQIDAIRELVFQEEMSADFLAIFDSLNRVCQNFLQQNAAGQARKMVALTKHRIDGMPDGFWKEKYQSELSQRFGYLLD